METVPRKEWIALSHRMIEHGRRVCLAETEVRRLSAGVDLSADRRGEVNARS